MSKHRVAILVASTAFASTLTGSADAAKRMIVYYTIASGSGGGSYSMTFSSPSKDSLRPAGNKRSLGWEKGALPG